MLYVKSFKHNFDILTMSTKDGSTTLSDDLGHSFNLTPMKHGLEESQNTYPQD